MNKNSFFLLLLISAINSINAIDVNTIKQEDDFLSALSRISEEENGSDVDALQMIEALADPVAPEAKEPSVLKQYAIALTVKLITYYGYCKNYVKQWVAYIGSWAHDEKPHE